jgi:hypothetical protein
MMLACGPVQHLLTWRTPTPGYEPTREAAMAAFRQELAAGMIHRAAEASAIKPAGRATGDGMPPADGFITLAA